MREGEAEAVAADSGEALFELTHGETNVDNVAFSPSGKLVASRATSGLLLIADAGTGEVLTRITGADECCLGAICFDPTSTFLAGTRYRECGIWDVRTERLAARLIGHRHTWVFPSWSRDGRLIVTTPNAGGSVFLWRVERTDGGVRG